MAPESEQDDAMILALASGLSWRSAAKRAGTSHSTIARRMKEPQFKRLVAERRAGLLEEAAGLLTALARNATKTLGKLLSSKSDVVRLGAARAILDAAVSVRTMVEFEQRLLALEERTK